MSRTQRKFLRVLRDAQGRGVAASAVPAACRVIASALETCGAIERCGAGRGEVLRVRSAEAFALYVATHHPLGLEEPAEEPADRVGGVRLHGDAKSAARGRYEGVLLRSHRPGIALLSSAGQPFPVDELTSVVGVAAITLDASRRYRFSGTVAIIENAEPFWQFDQELPEADLAIYAAGRLSERVLSWLASDDMAACRLVHWGDYDPVGCMEYLRLRDRCGERATMHSPSRVGDLLPTYGRATLITDQIETLANLRGLEQPPEVAKLVGLFDRHRRGLEQEALLM